MKSNRTPREIYISYECSTFHMMREGDYDEYRSHGVTEEQEAQWRDEFRQTLLKRLADDPSDAEAFSAYLSCVEKSEQESIEALVRILEKQIDGTDAFSCLLCAECICNFLRHDGIADPRQQDLAQLAVALLENTMRQPTNIAPRYQSLGYLKGMLTHEKIQSRATGALREIGELRTRPCTPTN